MDIQNIFEVIQKGLSTIDSLVKAGQDVTPAIVVVKNLITKGQSGTVTDDDLEATEAALDAQIEEFNLE